MFNIGDTVLIPCHVSPTGKHRPWNRPAPPPAGSPWLCGVVTSLVPAMVRLTDSNAHPAVLGVDQMVEYGHLHPYNGASAGHAQASAAHAAAAAATASVFAVPYSYGKKALQPVYAPGTDPKCCVTCRTHNEYAEPNQPGGKYKCFSCRKDPTRFML